MALSSSSTLTDALAQYNDNLAWEGDITKAQNALEAVRWLLVNRANASTVAGRQISFTDLAEEKRRLEQFVMAAAATNRSSFTRGKMLMS